MTHAQRRRMTRGIHSLVSGGVLFLSGGGWGPPDNVRSDRATPERPSTEALDHGEIIREDPTRGATPIREAEVIDFRPSTADPGARAFINQGVALLHAHAFFEAERSFRQAARIDPVCPAAYWGMAMANPHDEDRAKRFIRTAVMMKDRHRLVSAREAKYIEGLDAFLNANPLQDAARRGEYIRSLESIICDFPDDLEASAFLAEQLLRDSRAGLSFRSPVAVDALLQLVLARRPNHPCQFTRLLLWEEEHPAMALDSAATLGPSLPGVSSTWHRPGHIFERLRRFEDASWYYEAALRVDHAALAVSGLLPDQVPGYAHNAERMARALASAGRVREAVDLAKAMIDLPRHPRYNLPDGDGGSAGRGRRLLFELLSSYEMWDELVALAESRCLEPTEYPVEQIRRSHFLGRAEFARGQVDRGRAVLSTLEGRETALREWASNPGDPLKIRPESHAIENRALASAVGELKGHDACASGDHRRGLRELEQVGVLAPALLTAPRIGAGRLDEAENALMSEVDRRRNEVLPLAHLVDFRWKTGRKQEAEQAFQQLREVAARADLDSPPLFRLDPIAAALGYPRDWRLQRPRTDDRSGRPAMETLGSDRWRPTDAPLWSLKAGIGSELSLAHHRGKPVVLIFYLGASCLHCVEQIEAFCERAKDFDAAGLSLMGISTDPHDKLKKSIDTYGESFPFPLASDPELDVFKAYHAFDEFTDMPLHGTFLIDGEGHILWIDLSHEPFTEVDFILKEARRLLSHPDRRTH